VTGAEILSAEERLETEALKPMICRYCDSDKTHTSRFKTTDIAWLFLLHYPVRCHRCCRRRYAGPLTAFMLYLRARNAAAVKSAQSQPARERPATAQPLNAHLIRQNSGA
jgi:hypothetical protein